LKLSVLAEKLSAALIGDPSIDVTSISPLSSAKEGDLTFLLDKAFIQKALESPAKVFVVFAQQEGLDNQLIVSHPKKALAQTIDLFFPQFTSFSKDSFTIHPSSYIHPTAVIEEDVYVGPFCSIGAYSHIKKGSVLHSHVALGTHCSVGETCILHPHTTLYDHVTLGHNVILHAGACVGSDGFGYYQEKGTSYKIQQVGHVIIEDDCEIGANSTIDRGCLGATVIGKGTKIDNLVQIAHNVTVGDHCIITSQVGLVGSAVLGHHVTIGGQSGVDAVTVGDFSMIAARSGVTKDVSPKSIVSGYPAWPHHLELKKEAKIRQLVRKKTPL
jgi:UDP-3-O-[3-hydroxymyristoyl] glucosamine N-acyltransferase